MRIDSRRTKNVQGASPIKPAQSMSAAEYIAMTAEPKRGNRGARGHYGADGEWYDSDAEEILIGRLRLRERIGEIYNLQRQARFDLHAPGGKFIGYTKIDASFYDVAERRDRYQDAKGDRERDTALSIWKFKHVKAEYDIDVEIIRINARRRRRT